MKRSKLLDAALKYRRAGISIIPTNSNKVAALEEWKPYQQEIAVLDEAEDWFNNNHRNIAIVAGAVSGHLEIIDIDPKKERPDVWEQYTELVEEEAPGLLSKLIIEESPKGNHLGYRCPEITIPGNKLLARFLRENIEGKDEIKTLIETRGEGGYCVVTPSAGYNLVQGSFEHIPEISKHERDVLIRCAMELNEYFEPQKVVNGPKKPSRSSNGLSPGDDFNERGDLVALLEEHEWSFVGNRGEYQRWRRFWECKLKGMNTYRSAKAAGFSESYSRGDIYRDLKPGGLAISKLEQILAKTPETVRKITQLRILTDGLEIDRLALDQYKANPRLAITNPSLLKHLRQAAGVMPQDFQPQPQMINIQAMQIFMRRHLEVTMKIFELAKNRGIPGRNIIELQQHPEYPELLSEAEKQMDKELDERDNATRSTKH